MTRPAGYLLARGTAGRLPLSDKSVDMICCSPPFFGLRRYQGVEPTDWPAVRFAPMPGLEPVTVPAMTCCLGNESDPTSFTAHLVHVFRDVRRVLAAEGVAVVNMGDSYATNPGDDRGDKRLVLGGGGKPHRSASDKTGFGIPERNLLGIPWRLAFALQGDGWLLRSAPPWIKPDNAMPESVTSRPGTAHEMIFILAKSDRYFWDADATRRGALQPSGVAVRTGQIKTTILGHTSRTGNLGTNQGASSRLWRTSDVFCDALDECIAFHRGRADELQAARDRGGMIVGAGGDAAAILANSQSFKGAHFATWAPRLITPFIRAATSEHGCCSACGRGWRRVVEREKVVYPNGIGNGTLNQQVVAVGGVGSTSCFQTGMGTTSRTLGWSPACSCSAPARPAVVLDPFCGSGSTLVASLALGRDAIGLDLSADYLDLARRRLDRPHAAISAPAAKSPAPLPLFPEDGR